MSVDGRHLILGHLGSKTCDPSAWVVNGKGMGSCMSLELSSAHWERKMDDLQSCHSINGFEAGRRDFLYLTLRGSTAKITTISR